jgi:hypothetical protein
MNDSEMLEYVKGLSIEERLHIIEAIWHTINRDMRSAIASPAASEAAPCVAQSIIMRGLTIQQRRPNAPPLVS